MTHRFRRVASALATTAALVAAPTVALAGVSPAHVAQSADPGSVITVEKTVTTPEIPPKPDIVFVVDSTGSMGSAIDNVKTEMGTIVTTVKAAQPQAEFAVVDYRDIDDGTALFTKRTDLTADQVVAQNAVNAITANGGGDLPEAQLNALWQIGDGGDQISFRSDSSRIVVWFGDAPGHDPSNGHSLADAVDSLTGVDARVLAISVGANGLDATGQATEITDATGGTLLTGIPATGLSGAILSGLSDLPATVTAETTCDPGLGVSLDPTSRTVPSGDDAVFSETITVAADATQGATLTCTTSFSINGAPAGEDYVQTVEITVNDVTAPTVSCGPGVNPDGVTPAGYAKAGFYELVAADNLPGVTVTLTDTATGASFGPYEPGTHIKLTRAPGASSTVVPFTGAVDWHATFSGDALLTATDAAGNTATATCTVPPSKR